MLGRVVPCNRAICRSTVARISTSRACSLVRTPLLQARGPCRLCIGDRWFASSSPGCAQRVILDDYKHSFTFRPATTHIKSLSESNVGEDVTLHGYIGARSDLSKKISFLPLVSPDLQFGVQLISLANGRNEEHEKLKSLGQHSAVVVHGKVQKKKPATDRPRDRGPSRNEAVEVNVASVDVLNEFPAGLMFQEDTGISADQRHLQLRQRQSLRDALIFRSNLARSCREHLVSKHGFVEIETPLLFKSTPEGAREFLVPTRTKGLAYALPQSPQQYKQILMASGIPRYFQIAKCFRDEDLRADRQPEFTQLDMEMSFATGQDVMAIIEDLMQRIWTEQGWAESIPNDFPRLAYHEAMARFGSDKPDLRLKNEIMRIDYMIPVDLVSKIGPLTSPIVEAFKMEVSEDANETRQFIGQFMDSSAAIPFLQNPDGQPGIFIFDSRKPLSGLQPFGFEAAEVMETELDLQQGDVLVIQARKDAPFSGGSTPLGDLRLALHRFAVAQGLKPEPTGHEFLWVTEFPLFTASSSSSEEPGQGGTAGLSSTHHPFTAPASHGDLDLVLNGDPLAARADHYDLILNGVELGGGSRRIHDAKMQEYVLRDVLKVGEERMVDFAHMIEVLRAGCPPHAGIALGFDRLCAVMLGRESIRDVIAFPKSGKGEDMLVKAPGRLTDAQLQTYHLKIAGDS